MASSEVLLEEQPLLGEHEKQYVAQVHLGSINIRPLQYSEVPRAVKTGIDAMRNDSLTRYIRASDFSPTVYNLREYIGGTIVHIQAIRQRRDLTIDHGDAICSFRLPGDKDSKLPSLIPSLLRKTQPKESIKRSKEVRSAIDTLVKDNLGDRYADMIEITHLGTSPEKQGLGYGTALVKVVTDIADGQGLAVTLITTDAYRFYEFVGFELVAEKLVGVDNPTWDGAPVPIRLMLREPHRPGSWEKQMRHK